MMPNFFTLSTNAIRFDPKRSGETIGEGSIDGLTSDAWDFSGLWPDSSQ
jgi:hypothetical protein